MKLGEVIPRYNVLLVDQAVSAIKHERSSPEINLDSTDLTESEEKKSFLVSLQNSLIFLHPEEVL